MIVIFAGGPYLFVIACARAIIDAGSRSSRVHGAFPSPTGVFRYYSQRRAGPRVPLWSRDAACLALALVALLSSLLARSSGGGTTSSSFIVLALTAGGIAVAVVGVDAWDTGTWWRPAARYLRVALVTLMVLGVGVVSCTSVGAARSAALETVGASVRDDGLAGAFSTIERGAVAYLASPSADVVEVRVKPVGDDVAGLCRAGADVRYRRLAWTPDVLTLVEQRRATSTISGPLAFSVVSVPSDAYSVRTTALPATVVEGPCF